MKKLIAFKQLIKIANQTSIVYGEYQNMHGQDNLAQHLINFFSLLEIFQNGISKTKDQYNFKTTIFIEKIMDLGLMELWKQEDQKSL